MGTTACADHLHETCSFAQRLSGAQTAPRIRSKRSRFRLVPAAADGGANVELADRLELDRGTIRKWRNRFVQLHPDGLLDEPCRAGLRTNRIHGSAPMCAPKPSTKSSNPSPTTTVSARLRVRDRPTAVVGRHMSAPAVVRGSGPRWMTSCNRPRSVPASCAALTATATSLRRKRAAASVKSAIPPSPRA